MIIIFLIAMFSLSTPLYAAPSREAERIDAPPVVAYGKDSTGALRALRTDTDGVVQVV